MAQNFRIDWKTQVIIATSTSDASATIPNDTVGNFPNTNFGSWWLMGVSGTPAYINAGAAATSANALHPVGRDDTPKWIPPGTVMHALTATGTGQVFFIRCYLTNV